MKRVAGPCCRTAAEPRGLGNGSSCCTVITVGLQWVPAGTGRWGAPRGRERTSREMAAAGPGPQPSRRGSTGRLP